VFVENANSGTLTKVQLFFRPIHLLMIGISNPSLALAIATASSSPLSWKIEAPRSPFHGRTFGSVAGIMVAPVVFLDPNMMVGIQLYAFAAATVGGFTSPLGAVVGGLLVGVTENLVGTYVSFIGTELKLTVALAMIIVVLLVRPSGLFGRTVVRRV